MTDTSHENALLALRAHKAGRASEDKPTGIASSTMSGGGRYPGDAVSIEFYEKQKEKEAKRRRLADEHAKALKWARAHQATQEQFAEHLRHVRALTQQNNDPARQARLVALNALKDHKKELAQRPQPSRSRGRNYGPSR